MFMVKKRDNERMPKKQVEPGIIYDTVPGQYLTAPREVVTFFPYIEDIYAEWKPSDKPEVNTAAILTANDASQAKIDMMISLSFYSYAQFICGAFKGRPEEFHNYLMYEVYENGFRDLLRDPRCYNDNTISIDTSADLALAIATKVYERTVNWFIITGVELTDENFELITDAATPLFANLKGSIMETCKFREATYGTIMESLEAYEASYIRSKE